MRGGQYLYWPYDEPEPPTYDESSWAVGTTERLVRRVTWCLPHKWFHCVVQRALALKADDGVETWAHVRQHALKGVAPHPGQRELVSLGLEALVDGIARMRGQLLWSELRRRRAYERPLPIHLYDRRFTAWLQTVDDDLVRGWAKRFVAGWGKSKQANRARVRLALLRPMPLALLWPYYLYRCEHTNVLDACGDPEDLPLEYATAFAAMHLSRLHAARQRTQERRLPPERWRYFNRWTLKDDDPDELPGWAMNVLDLQAVPPPVALQFVAARQDEWRETGRRRLWMPVFEAKCAQCQQDPFAVPPYVTMPPFLAGCTCKVVFDPENDPFMEAPLDEDLVNDAHSTIFEDGSPRMRFVLRAAERAGTPHTALTPDERARQALALEAWLARATLRSPHLAALQPRLLAAIRGVGGSAPSVPATRGGEV
jgi:hypothetical protein